MSDDDNNINFGGSIKEGSLGKLWDEPAPKRNALVWYIDPDLPWGVRHIVGLWHWMRSWRKH